MVDEVKTVIIQHLGLDKSIEEKIILLKKQHWPYDIASQQEWMKNNLTESDVHVCLFDESVLDSKKDDKLVAYCNLVEVEISVGGNNFICNGIGNVCVDKEYSGKGYGIILMKHINDYLIANNRSGVLLCKESLVKFYEKAAWNSIHNSSRITIAGQNYNGVLMGYHCDSVLRESVITEEIHVSKNF